MNLDELKTAIINGHRVGYDEALEINKNLTTDQLLKLADDLRKHFVGNMIDTCSILNARSGRCSEDCKWCSQSKFHKTDIDIYPLIDKEKALEVACFNESKGVRRFSLVTSGRAVAGVEADKVAEIYSALKNSAGISLCASMGLMSYEDLMKLRNAGVERYHCNLETAPSYFKELCTTHTTQEKIKTIEAARKTGMTICSGGIIGMGESMEQRIELACTLADIGVDSIPMNILNPIKGTKLEGLKGLDDDTLLRTFTLFRIINPEAHIRFAGGRERMKDIQEKALNGGVSGALVGDYLTTLGCNIDDDKRMLLEMGREI